VKEFGRADQGRKIYSVEALEVESPASIWVDSTVQADGLDPTSTPYAGLIQSLVERIKERNGQSRTSDPNVQRSVGSGKRQGITADSLVKSFEQRFPRLAPAVRAMLERGNRGEKGGVVLINDTSAEAVVSELASKTGRTAAQVEQALASIRKGGAAAGMEPRYSTYGDLQGLYDVRSGLTFLFAPNLTEQSAAAVLLHESLHGQQKARIDAKALAMIEGRGKEKNPALRAFLNRVAQRMEDAGETGNAKEATAYLVEQAVLEGKEAGFDTVTSKFFQWVDQHLGKTLGGWIRALTVHIRRVAHSLGFAFPGPISIDEFVAYAMAGVERAAQGKVTTRGGTARASVAGTVSSGVDTVDSYSDLSDGAQAFLGKIGRPPAKQRIQDWIRQKTDNAMLKIRAGLVDRYAALRELDERTNGKDMLDTAITSSSWVLARMSGAAQGALTAMLTYGRIRYDATQKVLTLQDGEATGGLVKLFSELGSAKELDRFFGWIAANRSEKLMAEGREHLFTAAEIAEGKTLNQGKLADGRQRAAAYRKVFEQFQQYRDDVLKIAEQTGVISSEDRQAWKDEFYVPFYRVLEEEEIKGPRASKGLTRQEAYKKLKGGTENLNDLLENTLLNFNHLLTASLKNQAAVQAIINAKHAGIAHRVPESRRDTATSTFVLQKGQRVYYQIDDPLVFEALTALADPGLNNFVVRSMSAFKRIFTNTTTVTPQFILANLLRDQMQAVATSPLGANVAGNIFRGMKNFRDARMQAQMYATGGAFAFGHIYGSDPHEIRAALNRTMKGAGLIDSASMVPELLKKGWRAWNEIANTAENATRAAIYERNKDAGLLQAAFESRDLMDFGQHGAWPAVRFLIRVVPFLNARLQGLDKLYRAGAKPALLTAMGKGTASDKQAAMRFSAVTGALALASIALYLANYDDDDYRRLEDWEKDTYWFFKIGGNAFFLPKPFEVGAIATMAERMAEQFIDDKATGELFRERLGDMLMQTFAFSPVPQMFQPALDIYANRDAFTGRPIESMGMERLSKGLRARETTTAAGHGVSAVTRMFGDDTPMALSPVQADHLIRGYLGQVGLWGAGMIDTIWRGATGQEAPEKRWSEYQPVRRFYRDLETPRSYDRYSTLFYKGLQETDRIYADVRELQQLGRMEEAAKLAREKGSMLQLRQAANRAQRTLGGLNKRVEQVRRSSRTSEEKRKEIDRLNVMRGQITERFGRMFENAGA